MDYSVVIVAAGKSERFGGKTNKLLYKLSNGKTVIDSTIETFLLDEQCKQVIIVSGGKVLDYLIKDDYFQASGYDFKPIYCQGGNTRGESVYNGLMAVTQDVVFVHDGARCYLAKENLDLLKQTLQKEQAAMLVADEVDSIKKVDEDGYIINSINRDEIKRAQTPQAFRTKDLIEAYKLAMKDGFMSTDDAGIMEKYSNVKIKCVKTIGDNQKVTTIEDIK